MIIGVLIGFATLAAFSSVVGQGKTATYDPGDHEDGLNVIGSNQGDILDDSDGFPLGGPGDNQIAGGDGTGTLIGDTDNDLIVG